jgi:dolichyl-phosphate beta-glucosyltransferase
VHLSLVIPAYNEDKRIGDTLRHVSEYLSSQSYDSEILVVDDGSSDKTSMVVQSFPKVKLLAYQPNRGKGHAVKVGMLAAKGRYRVFYDADASTPIEEVEKLWPAFAKGAHVVIGSRSMPGSDVQVHQAWYRENMGRMYNVLVRLFAVRGMPDTQCGFKGFTAEACAAIFPRQTIDRFSFDVELLYIAQKFKLRISETPIRWINCPHTRVRAIRDSAKMILDLVTIRLRDLLGRYD